MDCECEVENQYVEKGLMVGQDVIKFCPLHASAPELLEALKRLTSVVDPVMNTFAVKATSSLESFFIEPVKQAKAAIAKAEGK